MAGVNSRHVEYAPLRTSTQEKQVMINLILIHIAIKEERIIEEIWR
jgi:hypothetical protein